MQGRASSSIDSVNPGRASACSVLPADAVTASSKTLIRSFTMDERHGFLDDFTLLLAHVTGVFMEQSVVDNLATKSAREIQVNYTDMNACMCMYSAGNIGNLHRSGDYQF